MQPFVASRQIKKNKAILYTLFGVIASFYYLLHRTLREMNLEKRLAGILCLFIRGRLRVFLAFKRNKVRFSRGIFWCYSFQCCLFISMRLPKVKRLFLPCTMMYVIQGQQIISNLDLDCDMVSRNFKTMRCL